MFAMNDETAMFDDLIREKIKEAEKRPLPEAASQALWEKVEGRRRKSTLKALYVWAAAACVAGMITIAWPFADGINTSKTVPLAAVKTIQQPTVPAESIESISVQPTIETLPAIKNQRVTSAKKDEKISPTTTNTRPVALPERQQEAGTADVGHPAGIPDFSPLSTSIKPLAVPKPVVAMPQPANPAGSTVLVLPLLPAPYQPRSSGFAEALRLVKNAAHRSKIDWKPTVTTTVTIITTY